MAIFLVAHMRMYSVKLHTPISDLAENCAYEGEHFFPVWKVYKFLAIDNISISYAQNRRIALRTLIQNGRRTNASVDFPKKTFHFVNVDLDLFPWP